MMDPDDVTQKVDPAYQEAYSQEQTEVASVEEMRRALYPFDATGPADAHTQVYPTMQPSPSRDYATWILAAVLVATVAAMVGIAYHLAEHTTIVSGPSTVRVESPPPPATSTITVTPTPTVPLPGPVAPTNVPADPDAVLDSEFINKLLHTTNPITGNLFYIQDENGGRPAAIEAARAECVWLGEHPRAGLADAAKALRNTYTRMPPGDPEAFTKVAVSVYCPTRI